MILGFEKQTTELSREEMEIAESWARAFIARSKKQDGKPRPISAASITAMYKERTGKAITGARARKIINFIRTSRMAPNLLANNKGYYISHEPEEINAYICSLDQRIKAIEAVRQALIDQQPKPDTTIQTKIELR